MTNTKTSIAQEMERMGLDQVKEYYYNLDKAALVTHGINNGEGELTTSGALVVNTSPFTGRSPNDKYLVQNDDPDLWFATGTESINNAQYQGLKSKLLAKMNTQRLYVRDVLAGADPEHAARIRIITDNAVQNLAASNMFIAYDGQEPHIDPDLTIYVSNDFEADPKADGLRSPAMVVLNFDDKAVLIGLTRYAGEIKKSVFTFMNYILPKKGILSLHCSANKAKNGDVALFFGLSGTGKTTLSSDQERALIGDDEHGWSDNGIFNFEGGCYAKTIRINPKYEPLVWEAINRFGAMLENVPLDENHNPDFNSNVVTENTRASYPLNFIENFEPTGQGGHPNHIFFLTADAFGVMPPLARLTNDQAMYYFLSGYTSKLAGTERGLGDKPQATFSTCFGAPFLPIKPSIYAELLSERLEKHGTKVWLLNTGWAGGGFGVGERIALPLTRAMIDAVMSGKLDNMPTHTHPIFNVEIPNEVEGVPEDVLNPEKSWASYEDYKAEANGLAEQFIKNFAKYEDSVSESVKKSGPKVLKD